MTRQDLTRSFWEKKDSSVDSMMLRHQAKSIDEEERPEILSYLPSFQGKKVLELGAGIGRFTGEFAQTASHVTAVDFIPHFLEENKKRHSHFSNITYQCRDMMEFSAAPASFDMIFMNWLLMCLEDAEVEILAKRFCGWLKPGGFLFFRESCSATGGIAVGDYHAWYRTIAYYTHLFEGKLKLLKQDNIRTYVEQFADPFQCYWLFSHSLSR